MLPKITAYVPTEFSLVDIQSDLRELDLADPSLESDERQIRKSCCAKYNFRMDNFRTFTEVSRSRVSHSCASIREHFR